MKKYALLAGIVWCMTSCNKDDLDVDIHNFELEINSTVDPIDDWDKTRIKDDES